MPLTFPIVGIYNLAKANWWATIEPGQSVTNYDRWIYAHATVLGDLPSASSYYTKSFNFSCANQSPDNDSTLRTAAYNAGLADGQNVAHGSDFLYLGNYVGNQTISNVAGFSVTDGLLYWAGQPSGHTGGITRNWLEVISKNNLTTAIPLVNDNIYNINVSDCTGITNTGDIVITHPPTDPYTLNTAFDWQEQLYFLIYGTSVYPIVAININGITSTNFSQSGVDWYAEWFDNGGLGTVPGYGKYCCKITDSNAGQYCFSIIVPAGLACNNSILTTYTFSASGAIPGGALWYVFTPSSSSSPTMQLCTTYTVAGTVTMTVYSGGCPGSSVGSVNRTSSGCSSTGISLTGGTQYHVAIDFGYVGTEGTFTATIS